MSSPDHFETVVPPSLVPKRLDVYLAEFLRERFSREEIKRAILHNRIFLNGKPAKPKILVKEGDRIAGDIARALWRSGAPSGEKIPLQVLFEDEWLLVIDKPAGMVVHPAVGNRKGTLVNALLGRGGAFSDLGGAERPGIVHRLDKETSGLLVVAKTNLCHRKLQSQFQAHTFSKIYTALVRGQVEYQEGHVLEPIGRHPHERRKMAVSHAESAKEAETRYWVIRHFQHSTLLRIQILTGRTHQIRVHLAHLGHPVVGDELYGKRMPGERMGLHATRIEFIHPKTGKIARFESPLPDDFSRMIKLAEGS
jgi:23S rRNA pseudouridine1911/1915/1917 synthase